ncbi:MAG TPA: DegT/DnrJ/EryC1/StrS family aminotransferase [Candidatus Kapabacteria bacterium]|nr:DegT/DnrJ/EryC1/StrS family aminotransferase [Candidatus Kapabacteria bacterium]
METIEREVRFHNHGMLGAWLIGEEEIEECTEVLRSRSPFRHYGIDLKHKARTFEAEAAAALGASGALAVNSGTSALSCAMAALRLSPGDEVIVPACTFVATANAVVLAGGIPVFAEIDGSLGLDPESTAERITPRTVGIIPVHLQGMPCRIGDIVSLARARGLWVVEDAAQAFGASAQGRALGTHGDIGVYSLQAHKTITCGEGGLLVTDDETLLRRARAYQDQGGLREGDDYPTWDAPESGFGHNMKISELHAAVALAQVRRLPVIRERMRALHALVASNADLGGRMMRLDHDPSGSLPYAFILFARDAGDRTRIIEQLDEQGIPADGLYGEAIYRLRPFVRWANGEHVPGLPHPELRPEFRPCPRSEELMQRIVRIPLNPAYEPEDMMMLARMLTAILHNA